MKKLILFLFVLLFSFSLACNAPENSEEAPASTTIYQGPLGSPYTDQYGVLFVWIEPGRFTMGDPSGENETARPLHEVIISKGFYLGKYEVTQEQADYLFSYVFGITGQYLDNYPSSHEGPDLPIDSLDDPDIINSFNRFNSTHTYTYRIPTEAEWEYAARAGTETLYYWGDDPEDIDDYEWYSGNSYGSTQVVGGLLPNPWGLHDMLGNVSEFVSDKYRSDQYYNGYEDAIRVFDDPGTDPFLEFSGGTPIIRGGAHVWPAGPIFDCSYRFQFNYQDHIGLRLVLDVYLEDD